MVVSCISWAEEAGVGVVTSFDGQVEVGAVAARREGRGVHARRGAEPVTSYWAVT